jgi:hypothetical protein
MDSVRRITDAVPLVFAVWQDASEPDGWCRVARRQRHSVIG